MEFRSRCKQIRKDKKTENADEKSISGKNFLSNMKQISEDKNDEGANEQNYRNEIRNFSGIENSETIPTKTYKTCPYCAEEILEAAIKCKHCLSDLLEKPPEKLYANTTDIKENIGEKSNAKVTPEIQVYEDPVYRRCSQPELGAFIRHEPRYYLKQFKKFQKEKRDEYEPTWNFSAFVLGSIWFFYRKQYVAGICWFSINLFFLVCLPLSGIIASSQGAVSFLFFLVLLRLIPGLIGNFIYYKQVKKRINTIKLNHKNISFADLEYKLKTMGDINPYFSISTLAAIYFIYLMLKILYLPNIALLFK